MEALGEKREDWNCRICRAIAAWRTSGVPALAVREVPGDACYVFPVCPGGDEDTSRCLMVLRIRRDSDEEVRQTVQSLLISASEAWLNEGGPVACVPVKGRV